MSAPDIMLMTPNGRFELGKKICIDGLTSFHAGSWQPAWGVRTGESFWMQTGEALSAIGALDYSKEERKRLAKLSKDWKCPQCGIRNEDIIPVSSGTQSSVSIHENEHEDAQNGESGISSSISETKVAQSRVSVDPNLQEIPPIPSPPARSVTPGRLPAVEAHLPTTQVAVASPRRFIWIDSLILAGVSMLILLIARRLV
ncbi:uncharacterized protein IL334_005404 [Kwoniella shivajii]|uniref:Rubredoxin-like domain-containing protein n=1 Tax=Kwoniella shivajii TaxID=564305 RepID=A0ABZ1D3Q7_9TREE|nr:hypothetical protein IL334_005404 [Kwoniella shivajii]